MMAAKSTFISHKKEFIKLIWDAFKRHHDVEKRAISTPGSHDGVVREHGKTVCSLTAKHDQLQEEVELAYIPAGLCYG